MPRGIARNHDEKRAAIRKGAAGYFAENGFDRASMTGAARQCGVSKALIYHYYSGKEALLFDILNTHLTDLVEAVDDASNNTGLRELVRVILLAYRNADAEHKLQLEALDSLTAELQQPLITAQRKLVSHMRTAVLQEAGTGLTDPDRLHAITMAVFGMLNWFYMWHQPGKGMSREDYADLVADLVLGGLPALLK